MHCTTARAMLWQGEGPGARLPENRRPTLLRASHFGADGMLRLVGSRLAACADAPLPSLFWAAGMSFSRSRLLQEVPLSPAAKPLALAWHGMAPLSRKPCPRNCSSVMLTQQYADCHQFKSSSRLNQCVASPATFPSRGLLHGFCAWRLAILAVMKCVLQLARQSAARLFWCMQAPYEDLPFLFFGEEQHMLRRMWMAGYDMFAMPSSVAFHMWSRAGRASFQECVQQVDAQDTYNTKFASVQGSHGCVLMLVILPACRSLGCVSGLLVLSTGCCCQGAVPEAGAGCFRGLQQHIRGRRWGSISKGHEKVLGRLPGVLWRRLHWARHIGRCKTGHQGSRCQLCL